MNAINDKELVEIAKQYRSKYTQYEEPEGMSSFKDTDNLVQILEHAQYLPLFEEQDREEFVKTFKITKKALDDYFTLLDNHEEFRELELRGDQLQGKVGFPDLLKYCNSQEGQEEQKKIFGTCGMVKEHYIMLSAKRLREETKPYLKD